MTEEEKIKLIDYINTRLIAEDASLLERELLSDIEGKKVLEDYSEMIKKIDLLYARKVIAAELHKYSFVEEEEISDIKKDKISMKAKSTNWINYLIMVIISALVSWIVFTVAFKLDSPKVADKTEIPELKEESPVPDDKLSMDEENTGIDIMGIALNRTGFYLLPYSVNDLDGVFGSNRSMTNNLPLTIVWDDKDMGLAVATFADENLEKLASIPYRFSKQDYFLGEEMFLVFSSKSQLSVNSGIIIEDNPDAASMTLHLDLPGDVYGAVVMDGNGTIVGICERQNDQGIAKVVKSKELYEMIGEMNLDKGVSYISMPSQNYLRTKSNTQRIEMIKPFVAWFNSK